MRICMVFDDDYPWDIRVEKVGRALVEGGHEVYLAVRNRTRTGVLSEDVDGIQVRRMPPLPIPHRLDTGLMFPAFFSPRWLWHITNVVRRNDCQSLLIRDLPLALAGIAVGRVLGLPVVIDLAENYPAALTAFQNHSKPKLWDRFIRNPTLASLIEMAALRTADRILVVCDEMRHNTIDRGASPSKVTLVGNTPDLRVFAGAEVPAELQSRYRDHFVLLYVGEVAIYRGLDTVVDALPMIRREIPEVKLVVVGRGTAMNELPERANALGVVDHLDMVGFRPHAELPGYIALADLCVIPHHRNALIDTTLPNKLFDYMALGKTVIATDAKPLQRVLQDEDCGRVYESSDSTDLARTVVELRGQEVRYQLGARGRQAVHRSYNWSQDTKQLLKVFESLR